MDGTPFVKQVEPGVYRHTSGKEYEVLFTGRHSETLEECVVYKALYGESKDGLGPYWIRPVGMFLEKVDVHGSKVARFTRVSVSTALE